MVAAREYQRITPPPDKFFFFFFKITCNEWSVGAATRCYFSRFCCRRCCCCCCCPSKSGRSDKRAVGLVCIYVRTIPTSKKKVLTYERQKFSADFFSTFLAKKFASPYLRGSERLKKREASQSQTTKRKKYIIILVPAVFRCKKKSAKSRYECIFERERPSRASSKQMK